MAVLVPLASRRTLLVAVLVAVPLLGLALLFAWPGDEPTWAFTVDQCLADFDKCRAKPRVRLSGSAVPKSVANGGAGCPVRFRLAEQGVPGGPTIEVCLTRGFGRLDRQCDGFPEMQPYVERGVLRLMPSGRFEGSRLYADELHGDGCDEKVTRWRFGTPAEIDARRADAGG